MTRRLYCVKCGVLKPMHPEDIAMGMKRRRTEIRAVKVPANHGLTVNGQFHDLPNIVCDLCAEPIEDGQPAIAETYWRSDAEGEPRMWEHEYE